MTIYSPNNQYYATIELGNVRVFDVKSNSLIANLTQKKSINLPIRIVDLKFSHDSEHLLITSALSGFIVLHIPTYYKGYKDLKLKKGCAIATLLY